VYLGGGWMIHSSSGRDGVSIDWVRQGWYRDRFVWSRRVVPLTA
jgi:cell wall-associated NlpC family hydrolase